MKKDELKKVVFEQIDKNKQKYIDFLACLSRIPAFIYETTHAQELVKATMQDMGLSIDAFPCNIDGAKDLDDFHSFPRNFEVNDSCENIVGVKKGTKDNKSLMLIAHIDTEAPNKLTPNTSVKVEDGKMYGLGVADSKAGVAMMLLGAESVLENQPDLPGNLTLLSSIGKRGAIGTLTAMQRGYHADLGVYLHPAETGHGFHEIKNFSMGMMDFHIQVKGKSGKLFDELDYGEINAIDQGMKVVTALRKWDAARQGKHVLVANGAAPQSYTKMDLFSAVSSDFYMCDCLCFDITGRMNFGYDETVDSVFQELKAYLTDYFRDDVWLSRNSPLIEKGIMKGTPAYIAPDTNVVKLVERVVSDVKKIDKFIYQYHGSSEVRLINIYGKTPTVGIGPDCGGLGTRDQVEWVDLEDYICGIKVAAGLIIDWCCE